MLFGDAFEGFEYDTPARLRVSLLRSTNSCGHVASPLGGNFRGREIQWKRMLFGDAFEGFEYDTPARLRVSLLRSTNSCGHVASPSHVSHSRSLVQRRLV